MRLPAPGTRISPGAKHAFLCFPEKTRERDKRGTNVPAPYGASSFRALGRVKLHYDFFIMIALLLFLS